MHLRHHSRTQFHTIRGLQYRVRAWGDPAAPLLVMLHGARDAAISFQFLVDALRREWHVVAPDWRGHGGTQWAPEGYWFADYVADLDALLDQVAPERPVRLLGHSLGGNAACLYAGVRPERVSHLVSLDGFGLPDGDPGAAPTRLRRWLDALKADTGVKGYASLDEVAARLRVGNPRLTPERALFFAEHLARQTPEGRFVWCFDPRHRTPFPTVYRFAEAAACFAQVTAPVLWVGSGADFPPALAHDAHPIAARVKLFPRARYVRIPDTGHNLHHDAPEQVAALIEPFLTAPE
jgi:pimeloyl-ACP methyl ester carboxylesterase